jgi:SAM-dependent methyltransferase
MPFKKTRQAARNLAIYQTDKVVHEYADPAASLHIGEKAILDGITEEIKDTRILDIGVGAGRTTPALIQISQDYTGIDYSAAMIAECKEQYPGITFLQCDARDLTSIFRPFFRFIFFSFNGIDCVNHLERQQILAQVFDLLEPGGLFLFCSHNMNVRPEKPWNRKHYRWDRRPATIVSNVYRLVANSLNYLRKIPLQSEEPQYAVWVDIGHEFRALHYYVQPAEQIQVLQTLGFEDVRACDRKGSPRSPGEPSLQRAPHVYYLARKPG